MCSTRHSQQQHSISWWWAKWQFWQCLHWCDGFTESGAGTQFSATQYNDSVRISAAWWYGIEFQHFTCGAEYNGIPPAHYDEISDFPILEVVHSPHWGVVLYPIQHISFNLSSIIIQQNSCLLCVMAERNWLLVNTLCITVTYKEDE